MMFDKFIFKENNKFYVDLNDSPLDCFLEINDNIRFTYENKKIFSKVVKQVDSVYELCILEEYDIAN